MTVTSTMINTTSHNAWMSTELATFTLDAVEFAAKMQTRVNKRLESVQPAQTIYVGRKSNLTTSTKVNLVANTILYEAITENAQTVTVSTVEYAAFLVEDPAQAVIRFDVAEAYGKKIGYALTRGREVTLAALVASLSQTVGTLASELNETHYLAAHQKLLEAGITGDDGQDVDGETSIFLSPAAWIDALQVDAFVNRQYNTSGNAIQRARIGNIYGHPVFVSNLVTSNSSGHDNVLFQRDCFALVVNKEVPVRSQWDITHIAQAVVGWNLYGAAELDYPPETPGGAAATDARGVWLKGK